MNALASNEGRAAAGKAIDDNMTAARAVANGIDHKGHRLDRRVHREFVEPVCFECVCAGIGPNIAAVAVMSPNFDIIDLFATAVLPNKDQLVLTAIERTHSGRPRQLGLALNRTKKSYSCRSNSRVRGSASPL